MCCVCIHLGCPPCVHLEGASACTTTTISSNFLCRGRSRKADYSESISSANLSVNISSADYSDNISSANLGVNISSADSSENILSADCNDDISLVDCSEP